MARSETLVYLLRILADLPRRGTRGDKVYGNTVA
jgi:hypothetical protein